MSLDDIRAAETLLKTLKVRNFSLEEQHQKLKLSAEMRSEDLLRFNQDLTSIILQKYELPLSDKYDVKIDHAEGFLLLFADIGHFNPVRRCWIPQDEIIMVDRVRNSLQWHHILDRAVGPRPPSDYVHAVEASVDLQQEIRETRQVLRFWKEHSGDVVALDAEMDEEMESENAIDGLVEKLKNGVMIRRPQDNMPFRLLNNVDAFSSPDRVCPHITHTPPVTEDLQENESDDDSVELSILINSSLTKSSPTLREPDEVLHISSPKFKS